MSKGCFQIQNNRKNCWTTEEMLVRYLKTERAKAITCSEEEGKTRYKNGEEDTHDRKIFISTAMIWKIRLCQESRQ